MGDFNVSSLEGILAAARTSAYNRASRSDGNAQRTHGTTGCGGIRIHAIEVITIAFTAVGCSPIVSVERHRRFGIPDDIALSLIHISCAHTRIWCSTKDSRFRLALHTASRYRTRTNRQSSYFCFGRMPASVSYTHLLHMAKKIANIYHIHSSS